MDVIDKEAESVYEVFSEYGDYLVAVRIFLEMPFCFIVRLQWSFLRQI